MTRWVTGSLVIAMSLPVWGQSQPKARFSLTPDHVVRALFAKGIHIPDQHVSLLADVVAAEPNPALDILTITPLGNRSSGIRVESRSLLKVACHVTGECLPFYAIVIWPARPAEGPSRGSSSPSAGPSSELEANAVITMRAGTHAKLVMDDDRSHIQVDVISLENGTAGHRIRVASLDRKQVYMAEVVSAILLKGRF
jgi:hypothetical protein